MLAPQTGGVEVLPETAEEDAQGGARSQGKAECVQGAPETRCPSAAPAAEEEGGTPTAPEEYLVASEVER